jgi:glycosyltransferase involved in cell wall biosynthesis
LTSDAGRRILVAAVHPTGRAPSQRFRIEQYVDHLAQNGFDTDFAPLLRESDYATVYGSGGAARKAAIALRGVVRRAADLARLRRYDIVFVQREAIQLGTAAFERIAARSGAKLVFDFDDAIWLPNVSDANQRLAWLKRPQKTETIAAAADLVLAGNRYLADYACRFNDAVEIVPTTIDTDDYAPAPRAPGEQVCIGWTGSLTTIQHFELVVPVLRRLRERFGERVRFKVIGDPGYRVEELGIQGQAWSAATEVADLSDIDIGIMPLPDDEWAKGKCGLKGLQYMALEIATVMSPVGVNEEIIDHGRNGFLAASEDDWFERLSELIESQELRKQLGAAARVTVVDRYSVDSQKDRYLELFSELLTDRRASRATDRAPGPGGP